ncbi:sigma-54 interaction domain-containing protein [Rhizorhapis suberifaciens]|uniref:Two-component system response regulator FlrC n=1 Tax=Rhizorhapis suberifaciens TaxID=13656 RepID=A0A840HYH1_9SPHN|nr:sigma-54 dependent transcriptional regulator [Rhizorhapis suberifaciens]MBB4642466.1 two-component system response regulator FlrC [Rhizorhapis suberifaciens]
MQHVELSATLNEQIPTLAAWLKGACFDVAILAETPRPDRNALRLLTPEEIGGATHRDILIEWRDGEPELVRARSGMPARIAFGFPDAALGHALVAELVRPASQPAVGEPDSARLLQLAVRIAQSDATVLIQGDTGTGKEGIARFVHASSGRADKDFIAVNCAALPESMMEAMLFGHRKGAFTGASASSDGLFQAADGGTLLLDEIAELPLALQAKLLRALQEGEVLPVGATHPVPVNVRIIAAGNRDLAALRDEGRFRSDLYWRLNVMALNLKPLAERRQDVRAIAAALLLRQQAQDAAFVWPTAKALEKLMAHSWPGNARELGNVLQRALVLREGDRIEADDLQITSVAAAAMAPTPALAQTPSIAAPQSATLHDIARASMLNRIKSVLDEVDGHRARAAQRLGISERTLRYRLAEMRELAAAA